MERLGHSNLRQFLVEHRAANGDGISRRREMFNPCAASQPDGGHDGTGRAADRGRSAGIRWLAGRGEELLRGCQTWRRVSQAGRTQSGRVAGGVPLQFTLHALCSGPDDGRPGRRGRGTLGPRLGGPERGEPYPPSLDFDPPLRGNLARRCRPPSLRPMRSCPFESTSR